MQVFNIQIFKKTLSLHKSLDGYEIKKKRNQFGIVFSNDEVMNNLIIDGFMSNLMIKVETNRFYGILRPP